MTSQEARFFNPAHAKNVSAFLRHDEFRVSQLFDKRFLIITGKGGVGKSTVSAAMALAAVRQGKRVLVCEVNTREQISTLLEKHPVGHRIGKLEHNLDAVVLDPRSAMKEYALKTLRFRSIYHAVFENRLAQRFLRAIPSLSELVCLGKAIHHVEELAYHGSTRYDLVILDAPATGHGVMFLGLPQSLAESLPSGTMANEVKRMHSLLTNRQQCAAILVSLPETLPIQETFELYNHLDNLGISVGGLVLNSYMDSNLSAEEIKLLPSLPCSWEPFTRAILSREFRARASKRYAKQLASEINVPLTLIPFLFSNPIGRRHIEQISLILEKA